MNHWLKLARWNEEGIVAIELDGTCEWTGGRLVEIAAGVFEELWRFEAVFDWSYVANCYGLHFIRILRWKGGKAIMPQGTGA